MGSADPREKLEIESLYYGYVTGELDKAAQSYRYRKTIESYPRSSPSPYGNLSYMFSQEGQHEKSLDFSRDVLRRYPEFGGEAYEGIAENLHRLDEARKSFNPQSLRSSTSMAYTRISAHWPL